MSPADDPISLAILTAAALTAMVGGVLIWAAGRARRAIEQLPETVPMLRNMLREGRTLRDAVGVLADLAPQPVRGAFRHCRDALESGRSEAEAFSTLAIRWPCFTADYLLASVTTDSGDSWRLVERLDRLTRLHVAYAEAARDAGRCGRRGRAAALAALVFLPPVAALAWVIRPDLMTAWAASGRPVAAAALGLAFVAGVWLVALLHAQDRAEAALESFPTS
jgi:hypothetical protein